MKFARSFAGTLALVAFAGVSFLYATTPAHGFDVKDSPVTANRLSADIASTYFFPSPTNSNNVVAVMNVYPQLPAGAGLSTYFDQQVLYTMKFDTHYQTEATSAKGTEQTVFQFSVGAPSGGTQEIFFYGPAAPNTVGTTTTLVNSGNASAFGLINKSFSGGSGITIFAGARQDPTFFDLAQFYKIFPDRNGGSTSPTCLSINGGNGSCAGGFNNPGTDAFIGTNVLSIVVEFPRTLLVQSGSAYGSQVAYWATTSTATGK
jgi:hypothetical protein